MTPVEWAKCVMVLRSAYKFSFKLDDTDIDVWFACLQDIPGTDVLMACVHMANHQPAFPSIADIRKYATDRPGAITAWAEVLKAVREVGYCGAPEWSDARIGPALEYAGGWSRLCKSQVDELPFLESKFNKAFKAAEQVAALDATKQRLALLPGFQGIGDGGTGTTQAKRITGGK